MPFINLRAQEHNFSGKTLRLLTWSDDTGAAALRNIAATFTAKTGAKVIADRADGTSGMVAKVKAAGDRPTYDVITLAGVGAVGSRRCGSAGQARSRQAAESEGRRAAVSNWRKRLRCRLSAVVRRPDLQHVDRQDAALDRTKRCGIPKYAGRLFLPPPEWAEAVDLAIIAAKMSAARSRTSIPVSRS